MYQNLEKNHTDPSNCCPISLTSCVCKTMEHMINDRLVWHLKSNNLLSIFDHLIRLETFICEAFLKKEHVVSIFFILRRRMILRGSMGFHIIIVNQFGWIPYFPVYYVHLWIMRIRFFTPQTRENYNSHV